MKIRRVILLLLAILSAGCGRMEEPAAPTPSPSVAVPAPSAVPAALKQTQIADIAQAISKDMGKVRSTQTKGVGAPVLVFEEAHDVVIGQLEQAVMLARAHDQFGLRQVVLEGYYEGALEVGARKVQQHVGKREGSALEDVGASLVGEGEINSVEYLALVYPDVQVVKGESARTEPVKVDQRVQMFLEGKLLLALIALGHDALPETDAKAFLKQAADTLNSPSQDDVEPLIKRIDEVIAMDAWTAQRSAILFPQGDIKSPSIERDTATWAEVRVEAASVLPANFKGMLGRIEQYEAFLGQRTRASDSMANALVRSGGSMSGVRAMVVGMAHTERVVKLLDDARVAYAVIRANGMDSQGSAQRVTRYNDKYDHRSVSPYLGPVLDGRRHLAPPQLEQRWLHAKSELYGMADDITWEALTARGNGDPPLPPAHGNPLPGSGDDRFRGMFVTFDKDQSESYEENGRRVIIMPLYYQPESKGPQKAFWVKLGAVDEMPIDVDANTSKAERALRRVIVEKGSRKALAEAKELEQIRVSARTVMMVASSKDALKQTRFTY